MIKTDADFLIDLRDNSAMEINSTMYKNALTRGAELIKKDDEIKNKALKKLLKKASEYSYIWFKRKDRDEAWENLKKNESIGEAFMDDLKKYLEKFDFKAAKEEKKWGFFWYDEVDDDFIEIWKNLSFEIKLTIFVMTCRLSDAEESRAQAEAGEDW